MPNRLELSAEPRAVFGKHVRRLRRQGMVPGNIYGHGDSRPIQAPARALEHLLAHGGRTGVIDIVFDGASQTALFKAIQRDPRSAQLLHIEFQAVSMQESVTSTVPLRFVGESTAVTKLGGQMTHPLSQLRITARAEDLPDSVEVDVSGIDRFGGAIHVSDLPESALYRVLDPAEEVVAMVVAPAEAEVTEPSAEEGAEAAGGEPAAGSDAATGAESA